MLDGRCSARAQASFQRECVSRSHLCRRGSASSRRRTLNPGADFFRFPLVPGAACSAAASASATRWRQSHRAGSARQTGRRGPMDGPMKPLRRCRARWCRPRPWGKCIRLRRDRSVAAGVARAQSQSTRIRFDATTAASCNRRRIAPRRPFAFVRARADDGRVCGCLASTRPIASEEPVRGFASGFAGFSAAVLPPRAPLVSRRGPALSPSPSGRSSSTS
jgi:hypothetical protein